MSIHNVAVSSPRSEYKGFAPRGQNILVRMGRPAEQTKGGIVLPPAVNESKGMYEISEAEVLAVGPGRYSDATNSIIEIEGIIPGVIVAVPPMGGREVKIGGEKLKVYHESEVFGDWNSSYYGNVEVIHGSRNS